ncbi:glycosyltransferase [Leptolyngbya sp. FACHB-36]|uniref:glycosyltransferase n=1 Tax=Leptolyngbya sp. FACHB-36 TaxID=2692808 RepID=UPI001680ECE4|nr:glycosyltransferase [Leptolyngbya sp. FACHB-36]MBD2020514.1 glycosyltransferase [Leptolyngbya sp. FACHB-36]
MNTPRELHSVSLFLPALAGGGAERAMLHLAQGFAERGLKTDLVVAQAEGAYLTQIPLGVRLVNLQSRFPVVLSKTLALRRYLQQECPDVLLSALDIVSSATWARRMAGGATRIVMCVQTNLSQQFQDHQPNSIGKVRPQLVRWFYPWADEIVAASHGVAADVARMTNLSIDRIHVVHNPVVTPDMQTKMHAAIDHPWFAPDEPPVLLGVGRLVSQKDFFTLIRAFAQVRQQRRARLVILGEGEQRSQLEALVQELGLEADVDLPGFTDNPYAYMRQAGVFVLSSIFEGFGNVVAEAIATGTPVVSTDCESGPAEILENGKYGRLVPVGDANALAEAIVATLDSPTDSAILRQRAEAFSITTVTDQYLSILQRQLPESQRQAS